MFEPLTDEELSTVYIDKLRVAYRQMQCEKAAMREILAKGEQIEAERDRLLASRELPPC